MQICHSLNTVIGKLEDRKKWEMSDKNLLEIIYEVIRYKLILDT